MMVQVIPVHYVPSEQLVPVWRPLMPQGVVCLLTLRLTCFILSGRANNIHQLAEIIKQVDTSTANGVDIIPLHHALAMDLVSTLKEIVKTQPGIAYIHKRP